MKNVAVVEKLTFRGGLKELSQKYNLSPGYLNRQLHTARTALVREIKKESDGKKSKWKFLETLNYMNERPCPQTKKTKTNKLEN